MQVTRRPLIATAESEVLEWRFEKGALRRRGIMQFEASSGGAPHACAAA